MNEARTAERIIRRFARSTNLLIAGRPARVVSSDAHAQVARELSRMLRALGATPADSVDARTVEYRFDLLQDGDSVDVPVLLGGAPLPERLSAADRLSFAAAHMPVSAELAASMDLTGVRIGIAIVLEPKTANLAQLLRGAGAEVTVYAHPDETDVAVRDELRARGFDVIADPDISGDAERAAAVAFLRRGFDLLLDDGSHLIRLAHSDAPDLVDEWWGAAEETTSGLTPLRAMEERGLLRTGVIAVNDAQLKTRFDNRYGTGQSCVFAIADLLEGVGVALTDQPALVIGYGPVGEGVAAHLRALGVEVSVAETNPIRALLAQHAGYVVAPAAELAAGALVVSATGVRHTIGGELLSLAAVVAVAGGVPHEIDLEEFALSPIAHKVDVIDAWETLVLDRGGCINITAGEGNPIEIMDLSFAVHLAAVQHIIDARPGIGVHELPDAALDRPARAALSARGIRVDPARDEAPQFFTRYDA